MINRPGHRAHDGALSRGRSQFRSRRNAQNNLRLLVHRLITNRGDPDSFLRRARSSLCSSFEFVTRSPCIIACSFVPVNQTQVLIPISGPTCSPWSATVFPALLCTLPDRPCSSAQECGPAEPDRSSYIAGDQAPESWAYCVSLWRDAPRRDRRENSLPDLRMFPYPKYSDFGGAARRKQTMTQALSPEDQTRGPSGELQQSQSFQIVRA
jgi:hypothetical protein